MRTCAIALVTTLAMLWNAGSQSDPSLPDTPVGRVFAAWIAAYNSADGQQLAAFKESYGADWDVDGILDWREQTGGLKVLRLERSEPLNLEALVQAREADDAWRFSYSLRSATAPVGLSTKIQTVELPADLAIPRLSAKEALSALIARADGLAKADRFSGVLLIERGAQVVLQRPWGAANRETGLPNTLDSRFRIGSMNKMFTSIAVLQLVEADKLSLDGTVGQYIPTYPNRDVATKVTVRHLLTHTGGTGDIFGPEFAARRNQLRDQSDYVELFGSRGLDQQPGEHFRYSNYGFVLLGAMIEKVSGASYYDYVERHIFKPCGMNSTGSLPEAQEVPGRTIGYMAQGKEWIPNTDTLPYRGMAAGGGYSTAGDLLRFAHALESGQLVSKQLLKEATTRRFPDEPFGYGYGFQVLGHGSLASYGHGGGAPGMNGSLLIYPHLGVIVVALSNFEPPAADRLVSFYVNRMPDGNGG